MTRAERLLSLLQVLRRHRRPVSGRVLAGGSASASVRSIAISRRCRHRARTSKARPVSAMCCVRDSCAAADVFAGGTGSADARLSLGREVCRCAAHGGGCRCTREDFSSAAGRAAPRDGMRHCSSDRARSWTAKPSTWVSCGRRSAPKASSGSAMRASAGKRSTNGSCGRSRSAISMTCGSWRRGAKAGTISGISDGSHRCARTAGRALSTARAALLKAWRAAGADVRNGEGPGHAGRAPVPSCRRYSNVSSASNSSIVCRRRISRGAPRSTSTSGASGRLL